LTNICGMRRGKSLIPYSGEDAQALCAYPETQFLRIKVAGAKKERSYRELCFYFSSCAYIASLDRNENMNTKTKVDHLTRLKCGFVEGTVFDENGLLHWIPKSLSYMNCDHPEAHGFIKQALEDHAALVGIFDVDEYKRLLEGGNEDENP